MAVLLPGSLSGPTKPASMSTENLTLTFAALAVVVTVIYGETDSAYRHHHPHQGCVVGPTVNSLTFVSSG